MPGSDRGLGLHVYLLQSACLLILVFFHVNDPSRAQLAVILRLPARSSFCLQRFLHCPVSNDIVIKCGDGIGISKRVNRIELWES